MIGEPGGKDWGANEAGMKQMDDKAPWLQELKTCIDFPPMQAAASYNLEQVTQQVAQMKSAPGQ